MKHFPGISCLLLLILLSGCASAVIVTSATVAARTAADPRSTGRQIDDGTLALRVSRALSEAALPPQARVVSTVYQGNVLLTGEVPDDAVRQAATKAVLSVSGVSHTWNETRTGPAISTGQKISDAWLASDIRTKLLLSSDTRLSDIKVITENSEVFLTGLVTPEEGRRVADRVSRVSGVRHVTTAWTLKQ